MQDGKTTATPDESDDDRRLRANPDRVFNERDSATRKRALDEFYVADPIPHEPANVVRGRAAISEVAGKLLEQFGPGLPLRVR